MFTAEILTFKCSRDSKQTLLYLPAGQQLWSSVYINRWVIRTKDKFCKATCVLDPNHTHIHLLTQSKLELPKKPYDFCSTLFLFRTSVWKTSYTDITETAAQCDQTERFFFWKNRTKKWPLKNQDLFYYRYCLRKFIFTWGVKV